MRLPFRLDIDFFFSYVCICVLFLRPFSLGSPNRLANQLLKGGRQRARYLFQDGGRSPPLEVDSLRTAAIPKYVPLLLSNQEINLVKTWGGGWGEFGRGQMFS